MHILISAGGTGGHIYPALSLAKALLATGKHQITFIGSNNRMEKDLIPAFNYRFIGLDVDNFKKGLFGKVGSVIKMVEAYGQCRKIIKNENIELVIGFGNYITVPPLLAAKHLKVTTFIHEQNALPGKANLFLSKKVSRTIGSYQKNLEFFNQQSTKIYGNPRAQSAAETILDTDFKIKLGFKKDQKLIVIFMGSLGSSSVNELLKESLKVLATKSYGILYATGKHHYQDALTALSNLDHIVVMESVDGIQALAHADLAITRAGATTLAELAALGVSAIVIPSPYVPDNGQYLNAIELEKKDACVLIEEKDLTKDHLVAIVEELMNDETKCHQMRMNIRKFAYPNANDDIIKLIDTMSDGD